MKNWPIVAAVGGAALILVLAALLSPAEPSGKNTKRPATDTAGPGGEADGWPTYLYPPTSEPLDACPSGIGTPRPATALDAEPPEGMREWLSTIKGGKEWVLLEIAPQVYHLGWLLDDGRFIPNPNFEPGALPSFISGPNSISLREWWLMRKARGEEF